METKLREHWHGSPAEPLPSAGAVRSKTEGSDFRLLLVDDNADDRVMVVRELAREFPAIRITEICTGEGLDQIFGTRLDIDLLITDYQLYWSDGLRVLERVREAYPEIPAIMFTGTGNEEVAVQAMKAGVYDYVLKSARNYSKPVGSVRGALQKREQSRSLAAAEGRYTNLFDTVPVGLFRSTPQGVLLDVNSALASILEVEKSGLVGRNFADLHVEPREFPSWREQLEREGSVARVQSRFKTSHGRIRWVEIHAKALRDPLAREIIYEGSVEDITRSKEAQVEREELIARLQAALGKVRTLTGLLPICSSCKKIRDDGGRWNMLESFIENHSHAHFTHSFCPECARRLYPEVFLDRPKN